MQTCMLLVFRIYRDGRKYRMEIFFELRINEGIENYDWAKRMKKIQDGFHDVASNRISKN